MEPVDLESTFVDSFNLYTDKGQQMLVRYHADPAAMVFSWTSVLRITGRS